MTKLLVELGHACWEYQKQTLRGLQSKRVRCDEIWSLVGCKQDNIPHQRRGEAGVGDVWTWTAMDADTKLMICWQVGQRDASSAYDLIAELASRLTHRVQLTTDGHKVYVNAVEEAFGANIDYAMLVKMYGSSPEAERRYTPAVCIGPEKTRIMGRPDPRHVSSSYVERQNLTMRMGMRPFTRLTNAFSKKLGKHACAVSLHFMYYNFARPHQALKTDTGQKRTPAMAAGIADHVWSVEEIVGLLGSN